MHPGAGGKQGHDPSSCFLFFIYKILWRMRNRQKSKIQFEPYSIAFVNDGHCEAKK